MPQPGDRDPSAIWPVALPGRGARAVAVARPGEQGPFSTLASARPLSVRASRAGSAPRGGGRRGQAARAAGLARQMPGEENPWRRRPPGCPRHARAGRSRRDRLVAPDGARHVVAAPDRRRSRDGWPRASRSLGRGWAERPRPGATGTSCPAETAHPGRTGGDARGARGVAQQAEWHWGPACRPMTQCVTGEDVR